MLCEKCGKGPACVHYTQIINGVQSDLHICAECSAKMGYWSAAPIFGGGFLGSVTEPAVNACPFCSQTLAQFKSQRKMGCEKCYSHFGRYLEPIIDKIQSGKTHIGKTPNGMRRAPKPENRIDDIKKQLAAAIKAEEYELAATLRDKIREMENTERNDAK